jgi:hypothetical protein
MVNTKELRVGNLVRNNLSGEILKPCDVLCDGINTDKIEGLNYGFIEPIPLTEEWLLKFGFNKDYKSGYIGIDVHNSDFVLTEPKKMGEWQNGYVFQFTAGNVPKFKEIFYVHKLQNLYFALTGEELTIKEQ